MLRGFCETARDGHCLCQRRVPTQVKLAGMPDFSARDEVRFLKVCETDSEDGVVHRFRVRCPNRLGHVRNCLSFHVKIAGAEQSDVTIWLDSDRLIELRRQSEVQLEDVVSAQHVSRIPTM